MITNKMNQKEIKPRPAIRTVLRCRSLIDYKCPSMENLYHKKMVQVNFCYIKTPFKSRLSLINILIYTAECWTLCWESLPLKIQSVFILSEFKIWAPDLNMEGTNIDYTPLQFEHSETGAKGEKKKDETFIVVT